jgi:hypothetical protein
MLAPLTLIAYDAQQVKDEIKMEYVNLLIDHNQWLQDHKHENLDAFYYQRVGSLDTYQRVLMKMNEE